MDLEHVRVASDLSLVPCLVCSVAPYAFKEGVVGACPYIRRGTLEDVSCSEGYTTPRACPQPRWHPASPNTLRQTSHQVRPTLARCKARETRGLSPDTVVCCPRRAARTRTGPSSKRAPWHTAPRPRASCVLSELAPRDALVARATRALLFLLTLRQTLAQASATLSPPWLSALSSLALTSAHRCTFPAWRVGSCACLPVPGP